MGPGVDLFKNIFNFFKSDPMHVFLSIITIGSFLITLFVYKRIRAINSTLKKEKIIEWYRSIYGDFKKRLKKKNIPSDIYNRFKNLNKQLYNNIGYCQKRKIEKRFKTINKNDTEYTGLEAFANEVIIILERDKL